jgi:hypothetical protein
VAYSKWRLPVAGTIVLTVATGATVLGMRPALAGSASSPASETAPLCSAAVAQAAAPTGVRVGPINDLNGNLPAADGGNRGWWSASGACGAVRPLRCGHGAGTLSGPLSGVEHRHYCPFVAVRPGSASQPVSQAMLHVMPARMRDRGGLAKAVRSGGFARIGKAGALLNRAKAWRSPVVQHGL